MVMIIWPPNNHEDEVEHEPHIDNNNNHEYGKKGNAKIEFAKFLTVNTGD